MDYDVYQGNDVQELIDVNEEMLDLLMLVCYPPLNLRTFSKKHRSLDGKLARTQYGSAIWLPTRF